MYAQMLVVDNSRFGDFPERLDLPVASSRNPKNVFFSASQDVFTKKLFHLGSLWLFSLLVFGSTASATMSINLGIFH